MRIKSYGLLFTYQPTVEVEHQNIQLTKHLSNVLSNFILINYFKYEKIFQIRLDDGFMTKKTQMFIDLYASKLNPNELLFDKETNQIYKVMDIPINQEYDPAKRKRYTLPIEMIDSNLLNIDINFVLNKYNYLYEQYNADL